MVSVFTFGKPIYGDGITERSGQFLGVSHFESKCAHCEETRGNGAPRTAGLVLVVQLPPGAPVAVLRVEVVEHARSDEQDAREERH